MPAVLSDGDLAPWIDDEERDFERVRDALRPCEPDLLETYPVPARVNRVGEDDPTCLDALDEPIRDVAAWDRRPPSGSSRPNDQLGLF
jgi:putative SOS response-associated peptidase YedK